MSHASHLVWNAARLASGWPEDDRDELAALAERLGATTQANAILGAVAATRALLAGESAGVALAAAREVATAPPAPRGWTKGKPRKT